MIVPKIALTTSDIARHYDELDRFYRDVWGEHIHHGLWISGSETAEVAVRQLVDLVAAEANVQPGSKVCDVGSGYGATARHLARDYGADVTALTLSPAQYAYGTALSEGRHRPRYLLGDWLDNGMPDLSFDVVIAIESASHMPDKRRFVEEAYRVLRPGGRFVFCAWLADRAASPWQVRHLLEPICREGRLPGLGTPLEYCTWIDECGFELRNFTDLSSRVCRTWSHCISRTLRRLATRPNYLRYLLTAGNQNRIFPLTLGRMWAAYRTGALRYGLFAAYKPLVRLRDVS